MWGLLAELRKQKYQIRTIESLNCFKIELKD